MKKYLIIWLFLCRLSNLTAQDLDFLFSNSEANQQSSPYLDSLSSKVDSLIKEHKFDEIIIPTIRLIEKYLDLNDLNKVHQYRFLLSKVYYILGWYPKSIVNLEYCHVFFRQNNRILDLVRTYNFMTLVYYKMGNIEMAGYFLGQAEAEKPSKNNPLCYNEIMLLDALVRIGLNNPLAKSKLFEVLKFAKTNGMNEMLSYCYSFLGDFYTQGGNPVQGCIAYQKAAEIAEAIGFLADHKALSSKIFDCLRNQDKHQEANLALLKYIETNDSLHHIERNEILNRSIDRYEQKEIREDRIDLAQNQRLFELKNRRSNFTLYGLLFSIASILLAGFIIILFYQQKLSANEIIHSQNEQINQQKITELENNLTLQTMKSMIAGQEEERERIAKDLHDSLGGLLSTIKLRFDKLQTDNRVALSNTDFIKVHDLIDVACVEVRNISHDLKPGALEDLGLIEAIKDMLNRYNREKGPEIIFQDYGFDGKEKIMESSRALQVYRIVQELLNNSIKHSKGNEILVQLSLKEPDLEIIVEDDGIGYQTDHVNKGMGLENIKSRIKYLKGEISIKSRPNEGTSTLIQVPVKG